LSHVLTSYQLHQVRQEARRLRDELGYLTITDNRKLHAIGLASYEGFTSKSWRWRVHIPAGRRFRVCYSYEDIPEEGVPTDMYHFFDTVDGEFIFSASAVRDPAGAWSLAMGTRYDPVKYPQSRWESLKSLGRSLPIPNAAWLEDNLPMGWYSVGSRTTESVEIGEPLVMLRLRRQKGTHVTQTNDPNPTDGIMIWIEEVNSRPLKDPNP
jgi:hypothetical protein